MRNGDVCMLKRCRCFERGVEGIGEGKKKKQQGQSTNKKSEEQLWRALNSWHGLLMIYFISVSVQRHEGEKRWKKNHYSYHFHSSMTFDKKKKEKVIIPINLAKSFLASLRRQINCSKDLTDCRRFRQQQ